MEIDTHWDIVKLIFKKTFSTSFHYSIATVNENGDPHVTPIGSLILGKPGHAIYFEEFANKLKKNIKINSRVCVLAVNSSRWFWFKSLFKGSFTEPPAIRLIGEAGKSRKATEKEIKIWQKRIRSVSFTKGYNIMWKNMKIVREIHFSKIEPVIIGSMTDSNIK